MKTRYEFYRQRHMALWRWLARNPRAEKRDWPGWVWNGGECKDEELTRCFACSLTAGICGQCPVEWCSQGSCYVSEFGEWDSSEDNTFRSAIALKIANLWPAEEKV